MASIPHPLLDLMPFILSKTVTYVSSLPVTYLTSLYKPAAPTNEKGLTYSVKPLHYSLGISFPQYGHVIVGN